MTQDNLGARLLRKALKARGWTRYRLSKELGTVTGTVLNWFDGSAVPTLALACRLEDLLKIPVRAWIEKDKIATKRAA